MSLTLMIGTEQPSFLSRTVCGRHTTPSCVCLKGNYCVPTTSRVVLGWLSLVSGIPSNNMKDAFGELSTDIPPSLIEERDEADEKFE